MFPPHPSISNPSSSKHIHNIVLVFLERTPGRQLGWKAVPRIRTCRAAVHFGLDQNCYTRVIQKEGASFVEVQGLTFLTFSADRDFASPGLYQRLKLSSGCVGTAVHFYCKLLPHKPNSQQFSVPSNAAQVTCGFGARLGSKAV